jgi:hypothetical protein
MLTVSWSHGVVNIDRLDALQIHVAFILFATLVATVSGHEKDGSTGPISG